MRYGSAGFRKRNPVEIAMTNMDLPRVTKRPSARDPGAAIFESPLRNQESAFEDSARRTINASTATTGGAAKHQTPNRA